MFALQTIKSVLHRRRFHAATEFCVLFLLLLLIATLLPRTWTSEALIGVNPEGTSDPGLQHRIESRFDARPDGAASDDLRTSISGSQIRVRLSAPTPDRAVEQLSLIVATAVREEVELQRERVLRDVAAAEERARAAAGELDAAAARLEAMRLATGMGGELALDARIAELEAESETGISALNASRSRNTDLMQQRRAIDERIEALQQPINAPRSLEAGIDHLRAELLAATRGPGNNVAVVEELERKMSRLAVELAGLRDAQAAAEDQVGRVLRPALADIGAQQEALSSEIASAEARSERTARRLTAAREEKAARREGNRPLLAIEQAHADAVSRVAASQRELQSLRDQSVLATSSELLPFSVLEKPATPARADGLPAWALAVMAIVIAAIYPLSMTAFAVRSSTSVSIGSASASVIESGADAGAAESRETSGVRWRAVLAAILSAVSLTACAFFMLVFG